MNRKVNMRHSCSGRVLSQLPAWVWIGAAVAADGLVTTVLRAQTPPADEAITLHVNTISGNMYFTGVPGANMSDYTITSTSGSLDADLWNSWDSSLGLSITNPYDTITSVVPGEIVDWMSMGGSSNELESMACANMMPVSIFGSGAMNGLPIIFDASTNNPKTYSIGNAFEIGGQHDVLFTYDVDLNYDDGYIGTVVYDASTFTWNGNNSGSWDTTTHNWQNSALYADNNNVVFDDTAAGPNFTVDLGGATVNPLSVVVNNTNNAYTIGNGTIGGSGNLTKSGSNSLTLTGKNTYSGGTIVNAGLLDIASTGSLLRGSSVSNAATVQFDNTQTLGNLTGSGNTTVRGTLTVNNFSQAVLNNNGTTTITGTGTIGLLTGSGNLGIGNAMSNNTVQLTQNATANSVNHTQQSVTIASGSMLDITNNILLLNYGSGSSPLAVVQAEVASGAIFSSTVNAGNPGQYTVGYADSTEVGSIPSGNVKVMYTLAGDANLDGTVNFNDFSILQNNYDQSGRDWSQGDFNHDGLVNFNDFSILQNNYDTSIVGSLLSNLSVSRDRMNTTVGTTGITAAVPEPAGTSLLLLGGVSLLCSRRRRGTPSSRWP